MGDVVSLRPGEKHLATNTTDVNAKKYKMLRIIQMQEGTKIAVGVLQIQAGEVLFKDSVYIGEQAIVLDLGEEESDYYFELIDE